VFTNTGAILLCQTGNKVINNILNKVGQGIGGGNGEAFQVGIQLAGSYSGQPSSNNVIDNNTIYQAKGVCMDLGYTSNSMVQNNICYQTGHDAITGGTGGGNTVDHNLLGVDPHFVQAGADFHLQDGSPAINAAVCLNRVSDDIAGFARPGARGCAAGAYEFGSTGTRPG
jgi:parallel beta-helix repeat protein